MHENDQHLVDKFFFNLRSLNGRSIPSEFSYSRSTTFGHKQNIMYNNDVYTDL